MASFGLAALTCVLHPAFAQQASRSSSAASGTANGSACFTATSPDAIVAGCDAFLAAPGQSATSDQRGLAFQRRGGARAALGQTEQAIADFRQMAATGFKVHEAQASIGSLEFRRQRLTAAEAGYREALKTNPSYALAHIGLGHTLVALGKPAEAVSHFDRALAVSANDAGALLGRGTALAASGDLDGAIRSFDAALKIDPRLLSALYQRAQAHNDKGDVAKALTDADAAVALASADEHVRALVYRGRLRNNAKAYADSIADCTAADAEADRLGLRDGRLRAAPQVCLGLAHQSRGELKEAFDSYQKALSWDRTDVSALAGKGYVLLQRGSYDDAVADFRAALKIDPKSQDALRFLGLAYSDKGDRKNADSAFAQAIAADPRDPWPLMIRAIAAARDGERERARADIARAIAITGDQSSDAILVRGAVAYFLGDIEKAEADMRSALALNGDNGQAWRMLARIHIRANRLDEAQRALDKAASLLPNDPTVFLQQGLIALGRKDYARAERELTRSLDINDKHAEGFAARGQAREGLGQTAAALADFRLAGQKLALDADSRAAKAVARQRLAALTAPPAGAASSPPKTASPSTSAGPATPTPVVAADSGRAGNSGATASPPAPSREPALPTPERRAEPYDSVYCRLVEGVFVHSRKYTGVEFESGCR
ncbi:MAG: tetratricopeptide repeat protein [Hyphomicrobiaceae bacterium]